MKSRLQHFFQIPIYVYDSRQRRDGWLVRTKVEIPAVRSASETRSRRCLRRWVCRFEWKKSCNQEKQKNERVFRVTQFHFGFFNRLRWQRQISTLLATRALAFGAIHRLMCFPHSTIYQAMYDVPHAILTSAARHHTHVRMEIVSLGI